MRSSRRRSMSEMNMVPFIDIMMVMLVAFMVAAPMLTQGLDVQLPKVDGKPVATAGADPLIISIKSSGKYYLNIKAIRNKALEEKELVRRVTSIVKEKPRTPVMINGDSRASYGKIVEVMSGLQMAGISDVGLITDPK